jgi:hypothetical protein
MDRSSDASCRPPASRDWGRGATHSMRYRLLLERGRHPWNLHLETLVMAGLVPAIHVLGNE